jgi:hypothetical protein
MEKIKEFLAVEDIEALDYLEMEDTILRIRNDVPMSIPMMKKISKDKTQSVVAMSLKDCKKGEIGMYTLYDRSS